MYCSFQLTGALQETSKAPPSDHPSLLARLLLLIERFCLGSRKYVHREGSVVEDFGRSHSELSNNKSGVFSKSLVNRW